MRLAGIIFIAVTVYAASVAAHEFVAESPSASTQPAKPALTVT